jgi:hypothetical protein
MNFIALLAMYLKGDILQAKDPQDQALADEFQ